MENILKKQCVFVNNVYVYKPNEYPFSFGSMMYFEINNGIAYCMLGELDSDSYELAMFKTSQQLQMFFDAINCA